MLLEISFICSRILSLRNNTGKMIRLTVIGAGQYGNLISLKYKQNPKIELVGIISPHAPRDGFTKEELQDCALYKNSKEWVDRNGEPTDLDVFDLCIHTPEIMKVLLSLVEIGARNFILPKPVAVTSADLQAIEMLILKYKLHVVIASQWFYSPLTDQLKEEVKKILPKISRIDVEFSQLFEEDRLRLYRPTTAFIPHIFQILMSMGVLSVYDIQSMIIQKNSPTIISLTKDASPGRPEIRVLSNLQSEKRKQSIDIFVEKEKMPYISVDFAGEIKDGKFVKYPSLNRLNSTIEPKVEPLEAMISEIVEAFSEKAFGLSNDSVLTFKEYLPVARGQLAIEHLSKKSIAVIGAGFFGIMAAFALALKGYAVTLFEKESAIMRGASLGNSNRIHMGYHYPRSEETVEICLQWYQSFCEAFKDAIVNNFDNYFVIPSDGSLTSAQAYTDFCDKMGLPYSKEYPRSPLLDKEQISLSLKVPEAIFDQGIITTMFGYRLKEDSNIQLRTSSAVKDIQRDPSTPGYTIVYSSPSGEREQHFNAVVNATYSSINTFNKYVGNSLKSYQYELCEVPIVKLPWTERVGFTFVDGPFWGVLPYGFSEENMLYDVQHSVLETSYGVHPKFKHGIDYYDEKNRKQKRFNRFLEKASIYIPEMKKAKYLYSLYATRIVLPNVDFDDRRPTLYASNDKGFITLFSGKIISSLPAAASATAEIDRFLGSDAAISSVQSYDKIWSQHFNATHLSGIFQKGKELGWKVKNL